MTDAPSQTSSASDIPLGRLHKMSTTAGISSQEYVAINIPSIVATLLGLASVLVWVFHQNMMLVIPLAATVFGIVALRQIRGSNGTQSGKFFAWAGILLAVGLGGSELGQRAIIAGSQRSDEKEIAKMVQNLGDHVAQGDFAAGYALFTDTFRQRVKAEAFAQQWKFLNEGVGTLRSIEWNGVPMYFQREGNGTLQGIAWVFFHFKNTEELGRQGVKMIKTDSGWRIDDIPAMFPPPHPERR